jgi:hypothetical protein
MMSKSEREELARVMRLQRKVARAAADTRQKGLLADIARQLSEIDQSDDALRKDITRDAGKAVRQAAEEMARICREWGVPEEFRPGLQLGRSGRGENASRGRRADLRKRAETQIAAEAAAVKTAVEARAAEVRTALLAGGLEAGDARSFLESLPSAEQPMAPAVIRALPSARKLLPDARDGAPGKPSGEK